MKFLWRTLQEICLLCECKMRKPAQIDPKLNIYAENSQIFSIHNDGVQRMGQHYYYVSSFSVKSFRIVVSFRSFRKVALGVGRNFNWNNLRLKSIFAYWMCLVTSAKRLTTNGYSDIVFIHWKCNKVEQILFVANQTSVQYYIKWYTWADRQAHGTV